MEKQNRESKVVVITGASSGNGRATALEFARHHSRLVLASRNIEVLNQVAEQCRELGSETVVFRVDVTEADEVQHLAHFAHETFGRIDVWVNNAGVGAVGEFIKTPIEAHVQVIRTNLLGPIYGAYAVLPIFKKQKYGILINTNSSGAWIPLPFSTAYSASKFGLRGFSEALSAEINEPGIHICEVFPAFVNTPGIQHAANFVAKALKNPPGAAEPERVARAIYRLSRYPRDRNPVMLTTQLGRVGYAIFPKLTRRMTARFLKTYFRKAKEVLPTTGNLFKPAKAHFSTRAD